MSAVSVKEGQGSALDPLGPQAPDPICLKRYGLYHSPGEAKNLLFAHKDDGAFGPRKSSGVWGLRPQRVQGRALAFLRNHH